MLKQLAMDATDTRTYPLMKRLSKIDVLFGIMPHYVKVSEYAQIKGIHKKTVYRWIKNGDINAKEIDGVMHVDIDNERDIDDEANATDATLVQQNCYLQKTIDNLQTQLAQAHEIIREMQQDRQRSDTIILQLTRQLENQTLMLEDMRNRSLWCRVKMLFAPLATSR